MRRNMKSERVRIGLTASEAARKAGISVSTLLSWERGEKEPLSVNLISLAHLYGCSAEYLLGMTDERNGQPIPK